jgi:hypothetical protein
MALVGAGLMLVGCILAQMQEGRKVPVKRSGQLGHKDSMDPSQESL